MRRILILLFFATFIYFFAATSSAYASDYHNVGGQYLLEFTCTANCSGVYTHVMDIGDVSSNNYNLGGRGYNVDYNSYTWDLDGVTNASEVLLEITYTGYRAGYKVCMDGVINSDGSLSGTAVSSWEEEFTWKAVKTKDYNQPTTYDVEATRTTQTVLIKKTDYNNTVVYPKSEVTGVVVHKSSVTYDGRSAEILTPSSQATVDGNVDFKANLYDDDYDNIKWDIAKGACGNTEYLMMANHSGHYNSYYWQSASEGRYEFYVSANVTSWPSGEYCFTFNPYEDYGEESISLSRSFYVRSY